MTRIGLKCFHVGAQSLHPNTRKQGFIFSYRWLFPPITLNFSKSKLVFLSYFYYRTHYTAFWRIIANFKMLINFMHLRNTYTKRNSSQESPYEICCGWSGTETSCSPSIEVVFFRLYSTDVPSYHLIYTSIILSIEGGIK